MTNTLLSDIRQNFHADTPPGSFAAIAQGTDTFSDCEHLRGKNWEELSMSDFQRNIWTFISLPLDAFAYYLGAFLFISTQSGNYSSESFRYLISNPRGERRKEVNKNAGLLMIRSSLTSVQIDIVKRYLSEMKTRVDCEYGSLASEMVSALD